jgi:hypothetical protein
VYKELEPSQEYKLEDVKGIHASILYLINTLHTKSAGQRNAITGYSDDSKIGYSISNFLNTLQYENLILQEQTNLFLNYLAFFHISQKKQLKRVLSKLEDFSNEMDNNLHNNMSFSIDDIEDDNVNQEDYLRDESDDEINKLEQDSVLESDSSKTDTINTVVTQISDIDEAITASIEGSDNIPDST